VSVVGQQGDVGRKIAIITEDIKEMRQEFDCLTRDLNRVKDNETTQNLQAHEVARTLSVLQSLVAQIAGTSQCILSKNGEMTEMIAYQINQQTGSSAVTKAKIDSLKRMIDVLNRSVDVLQNDFMNTNKNLSGELVHANKMLSKRGNKPGRKSPPDQRGMRRNKGGRSFRERPIGIIQSGQSRPLPGPSDGAFVNGTLTNALSPTARRHMMMTLGRDEVNKRALRQAREFVATGEDLNVLTESEREVFFETLFGEGWERKVLPSLGWEKTAPPAAAVGIGGVNFAQCDTSMPPAPPNFQPFDYSSVDGEDGVAAAIAASSKSSVRTCGRPNVESGPINCPATHFKKILREWERAMGQELQRLARSEAATTTTYSATARPTKVRWSTFRQERHLKGRFACGIEEERTRKTKNVEKIGGSRSIKNKKMLD
jgi:hypothetical protein